MRKGKLLIATTLISFALIAGCKSKEKKDLLLTKWHLTEFSGNEADLIPDSVKTRMYKEASIEFKKDGKYETIGMEGPGTKTGSWSFTADEKGLITIEDGSTMSDTVSIVELTAAKLVVQDSKEEIKASFKAH